MTNPQIAGAAQIALYGRGLNTLFMKQYEQAANHPGFRLLREVRDAADIVDYPIPEALPFPRKWKGDRVTKGYKLGKQTVASEPYEATLGIPGHHIRLGRGAQYGPDIQMLATRARMHPLYLLGTLLAGAFAVTKAHDGKALCADDHSLGGGVTVDNKGTAALAGDSFAAARAALMSVQDEKGGYRWTGMERLALVVPPDLEDTAESIVLAATGQYGETNVRKGKADVIVLPPLHSTPAYWFIAVQELPPFIHQIQEDLVTESRMTADSDSVFRSDTYEFGVRIRHAVAVGDYRSIWGSNGTT